MSLPCVGIRSYCSLSKQYYILWWRLGGLNPEALPEPGAGGRWRPYSCLQGPGNSCINI